MRKIPKIAEGNCLACGFADGFKFEVQLPACKDKDSCPRKQRNKKPFDCFIFGNYCVGWDCNTECPNQGKTIDYPVEFYPEGGELN